MTHHIRALLGLAVFLLPPTIAQAEDKPLWELGAGAAIFDFPDYPGSNQRRFYVLPVPYIVYRGDFLKIDRDNVRGQLFESRDIRLDLSLNGSVPVRSHDNRARSGMPDLDPAAEIGPSLNLTLTRWDDGSNQLELRLPVRTVIATNLSHVNYEGYLFQPVLNLDVSDVAGVPGLNLGLLGGPMFASRTYNRTFYGVDPIYATSDRPAFEAHGGYSGSQFLASASRRFDSFWAGGFFRFDTLDGAVFSGSPLVKTRVALTVGFALTWVFAESETLVGTTE
jgi:MipA family protein